MPKPSDLLQGTLDLLILKTIARKPLHGWRIAKRIQALSGDTPGRGPRVLIPGAAPLGKSMLDLRELGGVRSGTGGESLFSNSGRAQTTGA